MVDADRGLSATEVAERVSSGRVNVVPRSNTRSVSQIVRSNVFTRFNALLGAMLAVILVVGPVQDALFGFVLIANAGIGIVQELRAKRTLDRLSVLTAPKAHVVRDGEVQEVPVDRVSWTMSWNWRPACRWSSTARCSRRTDWSWTNPCSPASRSPSRSIAMTRR